MPRQLCDLREASDLCAAATTYAAALCYTNDDAFPIRHANSLDQPDVVANVHTYWDTVCYGYRNAGTDLHALTHAGDTRPHLHIYSHPRAPANGDVDSNTNVDRSPDVDVDTGSNTVFYFDNGVDAYANAIA